MISKWLILSHSTRVIASMLSSPTKIMIYLLSLITLQGILNHVISLNYAISCWYFTIAATTTFIKAATSKTLENVLPLHTELSSSYVATINVWSVIFFSWIRWCIKRLYTSNKKIVYQQMITWHHKITLVTWDSSCILFYSK